VERHWRRPDELVRVRVGIHTGMASEEAGDLFGAAVNADARIRAQPRGARCSSLIPDHAPESPAVQLLAVLGRDGQVVEIHAEVRRRACHRPVGGVFERVQTLGAQVPG
jgi:hypothetical protein